MKLKIYRQQSCHNVLLVDNTPYYKLTNIDDFQPSLC